MTTGGCGCKSEGGEETGDKEGPKKCAAEGIRGRVALNNLTAATPPVSVFSFFLKHAPGKSLVAVVVHKVAARRHVRAPDTGGRWVVHNLCTVGELWERQVTVQAVVARIVWRRRDSAHARSTDALPTLPPAQSHHAQEFARR